MVEHGPIVIVYVKRGTVQQLVQLREFSHVIVIGEHDTAHKRRLTGFVHLEHVRACREQKLDDSDAAHCACPM